MTTQTTRAATADSAADTAGDIATTTREVASEVADRAQAVVARLPDAAASTRDAIDEAARRMEGGSDEMLAVGASLSVGLAAGMLIGGAPRILVVLALIPATAMGFTLLDRYSTSRTTTTAQSRRSS
jgi:hypothetical protein